MLEESVVAVAWSALGRPYARAGAVASGSRCARCAEPNGDVAVGDAVSRGFTGRSEWADPAGAWLCRVCAWVYRDQEVRRHPMVVSRRPAAARIMDAAGACEVLRRGLPEDVAVTVPRTGRKHLLPSAMWGRVFIDDVAIPWSPQDASRLEVVMGLREAGAGEADLRRATPPWPLLQNAGARRAGMLDAWALLAPWRERLPWLEVALVVTRAARS